LRMDPPYSGSILNPVINDYFYCIRLAVMA